MLCEVSVESVRMPLHVLSRGQNAFDMPVASNAKLLPRLAVYLTLSLEVLADFCHSARPWSPDLLSGVAAFKLVAHYDNVSECSAISSVMLAQ